MNDILKFLSSQDFAGLIEKIDYQKCIIALIFIILGFMIARLLSGFIAKNIIKHASLHDTMIIRRITYYVILTIFFFAALDQFADFGVLLGAAGFLGFLTIALGIAARTSVSNIITGIFLIAEQPFVIGDYLEIEEILGEVISIDLLSVKLRTRDNVFIRIPNDALSQKSFRNLSRFPIRRFDMVFNLPLHEDLDKIKKLLLEIAEAHPMALESPEPELFYLGFSESAMEVKFCVWAKNQNYYTLKSKMLENTIKAFNANQIQFALPRRHIRIENADQKENLKSTVSR